MTGDLFFADAVSDLNASRYVIVGIPYDRTGSHREGTGQAPQCIRKESYNFETYLYDLDIDLTDVPIHDMGDLSPLQNEGEASNSISQTIRKILGAGKIPIILGGEHSITPFVIPEFGDISILVFDAHLDFRDEYEGDRNSHACSTRRISEIVGPERVLAVGVRSMCREELAHAGTAELKFVTADEVRERPFEDIIKTIDKKLAGKVYVSLDMDAIDPAHAPGVGTPEPFGLTPIFVRDVIRHLAPRIVGLDIVEVCPPFDNGNTASLAAKLLRDFIGAREKIL